MHRLWEFSVGELHQKINQGKKGLKLWATIGQHRRHQLKKWLTKDLEELMHGDATDDQELIHTKIQLKFEIDNDESYWEQWAYVNWLKVSDKNYKFFHNYASSRK